MTARFLHSFPARNAFRVLKQNQKMTIVTFILYLLGIPMIMGSMMLELLTDSLRTDNRYYSFDPELYVVIGFFCLGAAVFMGMIAAINSFTELHSKTKVDMLYSLPLTGRQRFFSDYIGGCCMYILPYVISVILGWIITLGIGSFVNWNSSRLSGQTFGEITKYYALLTFGLLALMLLYFTLSSIVTICCGTLFESIYTNILLNLLIPGTMAAVIAVIADNVELDFMYMWQPIGYISPIGGLIYLIYLIGEPDAFAFSSYSWRNITATQTTSHEMLPSYLRWIFAVVIISALLVVAAWQLYVRRKAEHVGKPFIYLLAYYLMLTLVTVAILCIINAGDDAIGPTLLFAAIVYFVMEVIRKRGFRKFWLTIITYIATVGASVGLFAMIVFTGCFGRVYYVPPTATINSVAVRFPAEFNSNYDVILEYTDRDMVSAITGLHKEFSSARKNGDPEKTVNQALTDQRLLVLNYNSYNSYDDGDYGEYYLDPPYYYKGYDSDYYYEERTVPNYFKAIENGMVGEYNATAEIQINYYTITGSVIHRSYDLIPDEYLKFMEAVQGTELYAQAYGEGLRERMVDELEKRDTQTNTYVIPESGNLRISSDSSEYYYDYYIYNETNRSPLVNDLPKAIENLSTAYQKDMAAMTPEQFRTSPIVCYLHDFPVYEACTETMILLKEYGFREFIVEERYGLEKTGYSEFGYEWSGTLAIRIYEPGSYASASLDYPCSKTGRLYFKDDSDANPAYEDYCPVIYNALDEYYPELYALMEAAQKQYISKEDCYVLVINGNTYIVPAENSDLAEAVIEKGCWFMVTNFGGSAPGSNTQSGMYYDEETGEYYYEVSPYDDNVDDWYSWGEYNDDWYEPGYMEEYPA